MATTEADILGKVMYFEDLAPRVEFLPGQERAKIRKEMLAFYNSLNTDSDAVKYMAGGAAIAAVVPGIGWVTGGLLGLGVMLVRSSGAESKGRERMKLLIDTYG